MEDTEKKWRRKREKVSNAAIVKKRKVVHSKGIKYSEYFYQEIGWGEGVVEIRFNYCCFR